MITATCFSFQNSLVISRPAFSLSEMPDDRRGNPSCENSDIPFGEAVNLPNNNPATKDISGRKMNTDRFADAPSTSSAANSNPSPELGLCEEEQGVTFLCGGYECSCDRFWTIPQGPHEEPLRICAECASPYFWALAPFPQTSGKSLHDVPDT
jgi:hypothetical protein